MDGSNLFKSTDIAIVGAGIIGLACAHYLVEEGYSVTIIDQGKIGAACSYGNCGYICPSHLLPLTEPGMVWTGIKSLFNPKSAFRIKPQLRPSFYFWLLQFARRCNHGDMIKAAKSLNQILEFSRQEYSNLFSNYPIDAQWKETGLLYVFQTKRGLNEFRHTDRLLTDEFNHSAQFLTTEDLIEFDSSYKKDLAGAFLYKDDASVKPDAMTASWTQLLQQKGVKFIEHCRLDSINKSNGRVRLLKTSLGSINAEQFVFATGAWSRGLSKELEISLPVEPAKGYSVTIPRPEHCPSVPVLFPEHRVGLTPFDNHLRLGSMMEFSGFNTKIPKHRVKQLFNASKPYLNVSIQESYDEPWTGWRPMTWDSLPIIGRTSKLDNVLLATGHNMLGMTLAPATGKLIAQLIQGKETSIDVKPYRPTRF
ncbi:FAD-binding oxidoreductase [Kangiella sp. HZ709]|uniref:NAD(P)/FAD-dependent oxidoreductase n=1 Tax=Kangiella sp. HZ709 TaxID=2666328 RepID=UPI0012AF58E5|nr:FAD-dependent oxidoreductase [Kangiella sp. HZ709]MRX28576.1 FAD-dependent oxidoreductase [Kangiella sp. HZ709]